MERRDDSKDYTETLSSLETVDVKGFGQLNLLKIVEVKMLLKLELHKTPEQMISTFGSLTCLKIYNKCSMS